MADIEDPRYPADGRSENDEILASTKPDTNSAVMDDRAGDSQFEDAESDFSPAHSATKSPMHTVLDEDSRDSGINHSESGSDRPEKQDLPESQYEDAEMDSNADPEEDNEPVESNGNSNIVDGFDEVKNVHSDENYQDDDGEYAENDAPEENHTFEQEHVNVERQEEQEIAKGLESKQDVLESQPEDESSMQAAVTPSDKSEEDVVEKYEEEEMTENYTEDDRYKDESEQIKQKEFSEPKQEIYTDRYETEENALADNINLQPEDVSYQPEDASYQPEDASYQPEDAGYQPEDAGYQPEDAGYQPEDAGYQPEDAGYQPEDASYQLENVDYQTKDVGYQPQDVSDQTEDVDHQPEVVTYQSKDVSYQPEDMGYQPEGVSYQTDDVSYEPEGVIYHPEDSYYTEPVVERSEHNIEIDKFVSSHFNQASTAVEEAPEYKEFPESMTEDVLQEVLAVHAEAEIGGDAVVEKEVIEDMTPHEYDLKEPETYSTKSQIPKQQEYIQQPEIDLGYQMNVHSKPAISATDMLFEDAPETQEAYMYKDGQQFEDSEIRLELDSEIHRNLVNVLGPSQVKADKFIVESPKSVWNDRNVTIPESEHFVMSTSDLSEPVKRYSAARSAANKKNPFIEDLKSSQFSDDVGISDEQLGGNLLLEQKGVGKVSEVSPLQRETVRDIKENKSAESKSPSAPKKYTNFDDIPVGMAYSYVPPKVSDSVEADQDRFAKRQTAPPQTSLQGDVNARKGRGRGIDQGRQSSQPYGRSSNQRLAAGNVPKSNIQKAPATTQRTITSKPNPNANVETRRQPVHAASVHPTRSSKQPSSPENRETTVPVSRESREPEIHKPAQERRRKADAPGTAVRVNRQGDKMSPKQPQGSQYSSTSREKMSQRSYNPATTRGGSNLVSLSSATSGTPGRGAIEDLPQGRNVWDPKRGPTAEQKAVPSRSPTAMDERVITSGFNQPRQQTPSPKMHPGTDDQLQNLSKESHQDTTLPVNEPRRPQQRSPGIARRQVPHNISQAQSKRFAEYGSSSYGKQQQPKEYEYPESLDLENESRHSSGCTSPYHQPQQPDDISNLVTNGDRSPTTMQKAPHGHDEAESEHQPVCTCGQVVYDDIAESQAYLIERNRKKVAQRAAELQAKREEEERIRREDPGQVGSKGEDIFLRPANRRRNSYELANRETSPTQENEGDQSLDRFGNRDVSGRPATSKKDLEEPLTPTRRYKLIDVEGVSKESRDPQLSSVDHATLAKLAERELADMERSRAFMSQNPQKGRHPYSPSQSTQLSPNKQQVSPARSMTQSPQKQAMSKTASPARSSTTSSNPSPAKALPSHSSTSNSPAKSVTSVEGTIKGVPHGQPVYDKTGLRLSGIHSLDLSGDVGQRRPEEDQFMDADEEDEDYDEGMCERMTHGEEDSGRYEDADRLEYDEAGQYIGEDGVVSSNTLSEIQSVITQSKNKLLKSPTFYVEKEPEEPVWVLRPFYAKKQQQDEDRRRQEIERERERLAVKQNQRAHSGSPTSLGSSDEDMQNRHPQGYLRKQESDDEDDDVEQKPLMSTSDYETGSSSHDHIHSEECYLRNPRPRDPLEQSEDLPPSTTRTKEVRGPHDPSVLEHGIIYPAAYLGSTQLICNKPPSKKVRMQQAQEAVSRIKTRLWRYSYQAPEGETQPNTEVDIFISTERVKVLNAESETVCTSNECIMDHSLKTISYIADIGNVLVIMARRRSYATTLDEAMEESGIAMGDQVSALPRGPKKIICHVFETEDAQLIAQSIGQAFSIAYLNFLRENGIDDPSVAEMDYGEVLNSQEIYGDDLMLFSNKECEKEILIEKERGEIMGIVIVESGWGSLVPTVVIANMSPFGAAARSGKLNIGDQVMSINGTSCVGLPLTTAQQTIKSLKNQCLVKFNVVSCPPVTQVIIKRPDVKYQLGFSVQNGTICSLMRGGIAERGGVRVGHRIIEINGMSVVATAHEKIVDILATAVGEIHMKTMPLSMYRLLTGQEQPLYL
ncbi:uncharacterized protein LOC144442953 [Glandiceps talaboti]